jgi:hypothetical protein
MPRGSKPGERRGGRQRATPNKRTVLVERILAVASCNPTATRHELLLILAKDQALRADIRMAIARKSFPAVTSRSMEGDPEKTLAPLPQSIERSRTAKFDRSSNKPQLTTKRAAPGAKMGPKAFPALELLLSITQDATALPTERRKAASEVAEYFLPRNPGGRKSRRRKIPPDEYGFSVDQALARELRDNKLWLACLPLAKKLTPYAVAQRATELQTRIRAIQESLQCPCPSKYGLKEVKRDNERLDSFGRRRVSRKILTFEEDIEEAHRTARHDSFWKGSEIAARQRLADLREKMRGADLGYKKPLTRAEEATFQHLAVLYPPPPPSGFSQEELDKHPLRELLDL